MKKRKKRVTPHTRKKVTVLQKLNESDIQHFTITDLKHLNGSLFYQDFQPRYPKKLSVREVVFEGKIVSLFEFPVSFEEKIESKITYHFRRKSDNLKGQHGKD
ncbi:hypothetical protein [uncultured Microscilla sp.]|uniref:hypothetical protein n=1 Tax=uncultured Microscilla sp. TaxID=432653 RepID=UPI00261BD023|nr:hypothetical protein [uncultured Microscilla sp.]